MVCVLWGDGGTYLCSHYYMWTTLIDMRVCRPGFRDIMILSPQLYTSDRFTHAFSSSFRFLWPFQPSQAWAISQETGLCTLAEGFRQRLIDIRCWTMHRDLHGTFPDLVGHIPIATPEPETALWKGFSWTSEEQQERERDREQNSKAHRAGESEARFTTPWSTAEILDFAANIDVDELSWF